MIIFLTLFLFQFSFASDLMDALLEKLNDKKKLVEEYSSLMKHTVWYC